MGGIANQGIKNQEFCPRQGNPRLERRIQQKAKRFRTT